MYLRILEMFVLNYTNLILHNFWGALGLARQGALKKMKVKLDLLYCTDMLLMVKKILEKNIGM